MNEKANNKDANDKLDFAEEENQDTENREERKDDHQDEMDDIKGTNTIKVEHVKMLFTKTHKWKEE